MGHFIIDMPSGAKADVRYGKVSKKHLINLGNLFKSKPFHTDQKIGYIIKLNTTGQQAREYRLLKTLDGVWLSEDDGSFLNAPDDETSIFLKAAIERYEKNLAK